jgi:hypothetical protein
MYVGNRHTATVTVKDVLEFQCKLCGHKADALVVGVGQGQGNSAFFLDESGAKSRASSSAEENARKNLVQTLTLARCPKCHRRDESAYNGMRMKTILGSLGGGAFLIALGFFLDWTHRGNMGMYICAPLALLTAGFIYWSQKWKWETAEKRVAFTAE